MFAAPSVTDIHILYRQQPGPDIVDSITQIEEYDKSAVDLTNIWSENKKKNV